MIASWSSWYDILLKQWCQDVSEYVKVMRQKLVFIDKYVNCHTIQDFGALLIQNSEGLRKHKFLCFAF